MHHLLHSQVKESDGCDCHPQGDGVPPTEAREFCEWLFKGGAGKLGAELAYSVCALGDK